MNILWITNSLLPEATSVLHGQTEIKGTGSWIQGLVDALRIYANDVQLYIASLSPLVKELTVIQGEIIKYYIIPCSGDSSYNKCYEKYYSEICQYIKPDVVHIHGTEYPHSLAALRACGVEKTLITIQGMVSVYAPYYLAGIENSEVRKNVTIRGIFRPSLFKEQKKMAERGKYEIQAIRESKYVGGRTSWDRENTWVINPNAEYFYCGEILRKEFYCNSQWSYGNCRPHSIFVSQAGYPLKGLHKVLEALSIIKFHYPDVSLRVAGRDITFSDSTFKERLHINTYGKILRKLIKRYSLTDIVTFTGRLNAEEMKREYLMSNVFVCPGSIENSPNSLGEAQILGVPCVASYVGGVMDMMRGDEENLYRYEETGMLAAKICHIFDQKDNVDTSEMRYKALIRHDPKIVVNELLETYNKIISGK